MQYGKEIYLTCHITYHHLILHYRFIILLLEYDHCFLNIIHTQKIYKKKIKKITFSNKKIKKIIFSKKKSRMYIRVKKKHNSNKKMVLLLYFFYCNESVIQFFLFFSYFTFFLFVSFFFLYFSSIFIHFFSNT